MWYLYRRASRGGQSRHHRVLLALRLVALALLFVLLAVPAIRMTRPPRAVFTAVLVDSSRSMSIADVGAGDAKKSRFDAARQLLSGPDADAILKRIADVSKVVVYSFDGEARRAGNLAALKPAGASTNLFRAVRDMEAELRGLPLASVVLVTDGCRNEGGTGEDAARLLKARRVPLYAVGLGNPNPPKDYEVVRVFAPKRVRRNTEVEVYATVRHTDYKQPFDVIVSRGTTPLVTRRVEPAGGEDDVERIRLALTPDFEGSATYKVAIPPGPGEAVP
ncbi:MAG: VWA domain-containing protein, partial [Planctomycetota bacterium]|nr:VWA domain-containing protein [Planctomycetota bacterium]